MALKHLTNEKELLSYLRKPNEVIKYSTLDNVINKIEELITEPKHITCYYCLLRKIPFLKMRSYASAKLVSIFEKKLFNSSLRIQKHNNLLVIKVKYFKIKRKSGKRLNAKKFGPKLAFSNRLTHGRGFSSPM